MFRDATLLVTRSVIGLSLAAHGAQKAFGWFEGPGPAGAAGFMESLGFRPGKRYAMLSSYSEVGSGVLVALGLGGPVGPAMMLSVMIVAMTSVHAKNGYFAQKNGVELPVMYAATALALAASGYGRFSLDAALHLHALRDERLATAALLGGAAGGAIALAQRRVDRAPT